MRKSMKAMKLNTVKSIIARQYTERRNFNEIDKSVKQLSTKIVYQFPDSPEPQDNLGYETDVPVYTCKFSPTRSLDNILATANENGTVQLINLYGGNEKLTVHAHCNAIFDLSWMPNHEKFVTVSGDLSAKLWDCREGHVEMVSAFIGHRKSVKCISFKPQDPCVFATGSRDGSLLIWDTRSGSKSQNIKPDQVIFSATSVKKKDVTGSAGLHSITGVAFQDDNTLFTCNYTDSVISVWDMRRTYRSRSGAIPTPKYQLIAPGCGFSNLCIDPCGSKLYASCMDSYIYAFNINAYDPSPISAYYGHENGTFYVKSSVNLNGQYLMSGSSNSNAYIWSTLGAELNPEAIAPIAVLSGHRAEVTGIDMSYRGDLKTVTCSDDGTFRLWCPDGEKEISAMQRKDCFLKGVERMTWKNTRVLDKDGMAQDSASKRRKIGDLKICRFFDKEHNCCGEACAEAHMHASKRHAGNDFEECTPPKQIKRAERSADRRLSPLPTFQLKPSSKRKLSDLPEFAIDVRQQRDKQLCRRHVLLPIKEQKESGDPGGIDMLESDNTDNGISSYLEERCETEGSSDQFSHTVLSSPTANLPSYAIDGTSPYIHKCSRNTHHKENIDWLTKLRKEKCKYMTPGDKKTQTPLSASAEKVETKSSGKKWPKRRKSEDNTSGNSIFQYFKVSTRS